MPRSLKLVVRPDGVGLPLEIQETIPAPAVLWALADFAGAVARPLLKDPKATVEVETTLHQADQVVVLWQIDRWMFHGSDLRHGTRAQFFEVAAQSRAASAAPSSRPGVSAPRHFVTAITLDEGVPVGSIIQCMTERAPRPFLDIPLTGHQQAAWLAAARLSITARLGEAGYQEMLVHVSKAKAVRGKNVAAYADELLAELAAKYGVLADEGVAALVLKKWERSGGDEIVANIRSSVRP